MRAAGVETAVSFEHLNASDAETHRALDAAYHVTYERYGPQIVGSVVGPAAAAVTLRLDSTH